MIRNLLVLLALSLFFSQHGFAAERTPKFHPHHLFIKMKPNQPLIKSAQITKAKELISGLYLVETKDALELKTALSQNKKIEYTSLDFKAKKRKKPQLLWPNLNFNLQFSNNISDSPLFNDPENKQQWSYNSTTGINVDEAYENLPKTQPQEIIVAVVDTGVDYSHEDLNTVMWINSKEIPNDGVDNDNNGYIDDIYGIDLIHRSKDGQAGQLSIPTEWHGTHVAGIIGAVQNNKLGIAGIANKVKIMSIQTVPDGEDDDELDSDVVEAFLYAAHNGAKVINCSFGKEDPDKTGAVKDVIDSLSQSHDILFVVSSGNDSVGEENLWYNIDRHPTYPASYTSENIIVVASTTPTAEVSEFSNIGEQSVDIGAPGSDIFSTITGNQYAESSGTSMAAPHVSGVAAMLWSYFPKLKALEIKDIMMKSVTRAPKLKNKFVSGGIVSLKSSLERAAGQKKLPNN